MIGLDLAQAAVEAAMEQARILGRPMSIVVVDASGRIVTCVRMDGSSWLMMEIATGKARTAAGFGSDLASIAERLHSNAFWETVGSVLAGTFVASPGGGRVFMADRLLGAIGVSGGTGEEDEACAEAAVRRVAEMLRKPA